VASTSAWTATFQNKADRELAVLDCAPIIVQSAGGAMVPDVALLTTCASIKSPRARPAGFVIMQFAEFAPGLAPTDRSVMAKKAPYATARISSMSVAGKLTRLPAVSVWSVNVPMSLMLVSPDFPMT